MIQDLNKLERKLGYQFQDPELLTRALSHRSYSNANQKGAQARSGNNERLEYLGDAALGFLIAEQIFMRFPKASEHQMTLMRAQLVRGASLGELAKEIGLGDFVLLGPGERSSGGHNRVSILADAMEAIFGAILVDAGIDQLRKIVEQLFAIRLTNLTDLAVQDPKTRLQQKLQSKGLDLPVYSIVDTQGEQHNQVFTVVCKVKKLKLSAEAAANSRKEAEKMAAEKVLAGMQGMEVDGDR